MISIDIEAFDKYNELKEKYIEKYKDLNLPEFLLFPKEFYDINDYGIQAQVLETALKDDIRVEQTEYIQTAHETNLDRRIEENIEISTQKRMK